MKIAIKCSVCGVELMRERYVVNQTLKRGRKICCSHVCSAKSNTKHIGNANPCTKRNTDDEFSPFRFHLQKIKERCRRFPKLGECELTVEDLKAQWERQDGICPYTGWPMKTPNNTNHYKCLERTPDRASVDRIDNDKGYTKKNIQFVSLIAQYAKNCWDDEAVYNFCDAVSKRKIPPVEPAGSEVEVEGVEPSCIRSDT